MSTSSNDIGYTKLIEMDTKTDSNLPPVACKPYTCPPKHQEQARNGLKVLEKV